MYDLDELPSPRVAELFLDSPPTSSRAASTTTRDGTRNSLAAHQPMLQSSYHNLQTEMFDGPPQPIVASSLDFADHSSQRSNSGGSRLSNTSFGFLRSSGKATIRSVLFDKKQPDDQFDSLSSVWRTLMNSEAAVQDDIQRLLDMQALCLTSGLPPNVPGSHLITEPDTRSETSSHTPRGTSYSSATSRSRLPAPIDPPIRVNRRGEIIPVRQPEPSGPPSLRTARTGLSRAIASLAQFKAEGESHIAAAISERKTALSHLIKLSSKRAEIATNLEALADDDEEPLGQELRHLNAEHTSLELQIRRMEEELSELRDRSKKVEIRVDGIRNRREAGLSGYKGALREAEAELKLVIGRPPVRPLDMDSIRQSSGRLVSASDWVTSASGGRETMQLIPERRTVQMLTDWWNAEIFVLESMNKEIGRERVALEDGLDVWTQVTTRVLEFERNLRSLSSRAGGHIDSDQHYPDMLAGYLVEMRVVISELQGHAKLATERGWNLLVCGIGAELEAFEQAERLLRATFDHVDDPTLTRTSDGTASFFERNPLGLVGANGHDGREIDDRLQDLLVPEIEQTEDLYHTLTVRGQSEGENDVPAGLLTEA